MKNKEKKLKIESFPRLQVLLFYYTTSEIGADIYVHFI